MEILQWLFLLKDYICTPENLFWWDSVLWGKTAIPCSCSCSCRPYIHAYVKSLWISTVWITIISIIFYSIRLDSHSFATSLLLDTHRAIDAVCGLYQRLVYRKQYTTLLVCCVQKPVTVIWTRATMLSKLMVPVESSSFYRFIDDKNVDVLQMLWWKMKKQKTNQRPGKLTRPHGIGSWWMETSQSGQESKCFMIELLTFEPFMSKFYTTYSLIFFMQKIIARMLNQLSLQDF